jgi:hypothetical protein
MGFPPESPAVQYLGGGRVVINNKLGAWDLSAAKKNCKKCFGRGYTGRYVHTGEVLVCPCVPMKIQEPPPSPPEVVEARGAYKGPSLTDHPQDGPTTAPGPVVDEEIGGENEKIDQSPPQLVESANP